MAYPTRLLSIVANTFRVLNIVGNTCALDAIRLTGLEQMIGPIYF